MNSKLIKHCPECGATIQKLTCEEIFHKILALEQFDKGLRAQHFKIVACYIIQHSSPYTEKAILSVKEALIQNVVNQVPASVILQKHKKLFAGNTNKVKRDVQDISITLKNWTQTIQDVYHQADGSVVEKDVTEWAHSLVKDLNKFS